MVWSTYGSRFTVSLGLITVLFSIVAAQTPADSGSLAQVPRTRVYEHPSAPYPYSDAGLTDSVVKSLGDQVADWVRRGQIVGAEVLVVKQGAIAWHEVFGLRDLETREPMSPDGVFRIRSMTKPMLGAATMRLVERGVINLDDLASKYISAFDPETWNNVTVRCLLEHTSGLGFSPFPRDRMSYPSLRASVDDLANVGPTRTPGEFWYSDAGTATLGAILEEATGLSLDSVFVEDVFAPLGLDDSHTRFEPGVSWSERMNSTHRWSSDTHAHERYWHSSEAQEMPYFRASGGVYSTVFDYAVFLDAWRLALDSKNPEFLSAATAETAIDQITEVSYGLLWEMFDDPEGNPLLFGHSGSDGTMGFCVPDEELLVLFFTQSRGCDCRDQFTMLAGFSSEFGALDEYEGLGRWRDRTPTLKMAMLGDEERDSYVGWYDVRGGTVEIRNENGWLRLLRGMSPPVSAGGANVHTEEPAIVCRPALAVPVASIDLIPLGDDRFMLGRVEGRSVRELYWPAHELEFSRDGESVIGYEFAYDPQVIERGRKYRWEVASPAPRRESIPEDLMTTIDGTFESGYYGTVNVATDSSYVLLHFGQEVDTLFYQSAGFFISTRGDVVTFAPDTETGLWRMRVLEKSGYAYEFEKPE